MNKNYFRKSITALLAAMTTFSGMQFTAYAEGTDTQTDDPYVEIVEEETPPEAETEEVIAESDDQSAEDAVPAENAETREDNEPVEEQEEAEPDDVTYSEPEEVAPEEESEPTVIGNILVAESAAEFAGAVSQIPDSSENRVMVATEHNLADVLTDIEYTAVVYDGVYVVDFGSEEAKNSGMAILADSVGEENVNEDVAFTLDDNEDHSNLLEEEPQSEEAETVVVTESVPEEMKLLESTLKNTAYSEGKAIVALIDTGASEGYAHEYVNLTDSASVYDENGHGTYMASLINEYSDGNAVILSIKAFDAAGHTTSSTMYAAVKYAIEAGADIINISASANDSKDAAEFKNVVKEAVNRGIDVIASTGNEGIDAATKIPANIDGVIGVSGYNAETKQIIGNRGSYVDYAVTARSTSAAAAMLSGIVAGGTLENCLNDIVFKVDEEGNIADDPTDETSKWELNCSSAVGVRWQIEVETADSTTFDEDGKHYKMVWWPNPQNNPSGTMYGRFSVKLGPSDTNPLSWTENHGFNPVSQTVSNVNAFWADNLSDVYGTVGHDYWKDDNPEAKPLTDNRPHYANLGEIWQVRTSGEEIKHYYYRSGGGVTVSDIVSLDTSKYIYSGFKYYVYDTDDQPNFQPNFASAMSTGGYHWQANKNGNPVVSSGGTANRIDLYGGGDNRTDRPRRIHIVLKLNLVKKPHNVRVTYAELPSDKSNHILKSQFVAVSGKYQGDSYSYTTASTLSEGNVTYYRYSRSDGGNAATLSGTMPDADVDYTVYYRRQFNVNETYVDTDTGTVLKPRFVAVSGKYKDDSYSYDNPATITVGGVTYYRHKCKEGGDGAKVSGKMPYGDVEYTIYYRRKYNLTVNYVELGNTSNVLQNPTKQEHFIGDTYSVTTPQRITKSGRTYEWNSRSDGKTDKVVTDKMPAKDVSYTIYYTLNHIIQTKVINGKITRDNNGTLGPNNYNGDWVNAYTDIVKKSSRTVEYEPKPDYTLDYIKVDGKQLSLDEMIQFESAYTFANINADHKIEVKYSVSPINPEKAKSVYNSEGVEINKEMVLAGDILTYEIALENTFSETKTFTVTDVMPAETSYVDGSASHGGSYDTAKRMLTWVFQLPVGETRDLSFKVKILDEAKGKTEYNTAHVIANMYEGDTNTTENPVLPDPEKSVLDDEGNDINETMNDPEDVLHYEILVQNPASAAKLFKVSDKMINQTVIESSISNNGTVVGDTIKWEVNIPAKSSVTLKFDAKANGYDLKVPNTATVAVDKVTIDTNETVIWTPPVPVKAVETINGIDINGKSIKFNDEFFYKIKVRNNSELTKSFVVKDSIPEEVRFIEAGHYNGNYVKGGSGAMSLDDRNVTWTFDLTPDEERVLYIKGRLEAVDVTFANRATQIVERSVSESNEVSNWSGRIIINAEIEEYYEPYGQPSFIYSITDKNGTGDTWYRMIIIDTTTRKGQAVYDIPTGYGPDTWVVKDEKNARYTFVSAAPETANFTTEGNTGTGLITQTSRVGIVDYLYRITKWDETSHMDAVTNTLNYRRS